MEKSFLWAAMLMLALIILPVTPVQAAEEETADAGKVFILDDQRVISYDEINLEIIQGLSEDELQRLKEKVIAEKVDVYGLFVLDDNTVISYNDVTDEVTAEIIQGLSEDELRRLKDKVIADRIKSKEMPQRNISLDDKQMQQAKEKWNAIKKELISKNKLKLQPYNKSGANALKN
jgi:hypothetical protein